MERLHTFAKHPRKRRRGYRLAHAEIKREYARQGKSINHKRVHRLWREVGTSFVSERVCQTLERLIQKRGIPRAFRMDNGPEFIALALRGLCYRRGIDPGYIEPGKPWQNGVAESFHSRLRDEFMDGEVFYSVREAQARLNGWRRYFNEERLHSSLGYQTPKEFAVSYAARTAEIEAINGT